MNERVHEHRDSHANSSHESSSEPARSVDFGKHRVDTPRKTEIARGLKLQGLRAEDVLVESNLVQKILVI